MVGSGALGERVVGRTDRVWIGGFIYLDYEGGWSWLHPQFLCGHSQRYGAQRDHRTQAPHFATLAAERPKGHSSGVQCRDTRHARTLCLKLCIAYGDAGLGRNENGRLGSAMRS